MLGFKNLELSDINDVKKFFPLSTSMACDNTIGGAFIWRDLFHTEYLIDNDVIIFKVDYPNIGTGFTTPLSSDIRGIIHGFDLIDNYCHETGVKKMFCHVTESDFEFYDKRYKTNKNLADGWGDYLYKASDLMSLQGSSYIKIRNRVNHFKKEHPNYVYEDINDNNITKMRAMLDKYTTHVVKDSVIYNEDIKKTYEVLDNYDKYSLDGGCILVDGNVVGFEIGEIINNVLFIHIEKADRDYGGSYQVSYNEYIKRKASEDMFVNREDSSGDVALSVSKERMNPYCIIQKYNIEVI